MNILIAVETLLLTVLMIVVLGLLRSHAEILKWLAEGHTRAASDDLEAVANRPDRAHDQVAPDIAGRSLGNTAVTLQPSARKQNTLLAFLSSGCSSCESIWAGMRSGISDDLPANLRVIAVTKDRTHESPSKLAKLVPGDVELIMSSSAWEDYEVPRYPYFIYIDGASGNIHGEGTAESWTQVLSLLEDSLLEIDAASVGENSESRPLTRIEREDSELAAAGIHPGHPSLYEPPHGLPLVQQDG